MTTMLEKAAMAAYCNGNEQVWAEQAHCRNDEVREFWRDIVRTVLRSIREPDETAARVGGEQTFPEASDDGASVASATFTAMIDHILRDGECRELGADLPAKTVFMDTIGGENVLIEAGDVQPVINDHIITEGEGK